MANADKVIRVVQFKLPDKQLRFKGPNSRALVTIAPTLYATRPKGRADELGRELCNALGGKPGAEGLDCGPLPRETIAVHIAPAEDVLKTLKELAEDTGKEGLLLFYFVGAAVTVPGEHLTGKISLALDFQHHGGAGMRIDAGQLAGALKGTRAKHVVIIYECSGSAAAFSCHLAGDEGMKKFAANVSVVAVLATGESEIFYEEVGSGGFTYFFQETLRMPIYAEPGRIDLTGAVHEASRLCSAVAGLVYYEDIVGGGPMPAAVFRDIQWAIKELKNFRAAAKDGGGTDTPDTGSANRFGFIYGHMRWPVVPCIQLENWLRGTAASCLRILHPRYLNKDEPCLYNAVIATLAHSCAKVIHLHQPEHKDDRNLFLLLMARIGEMLGQFVASELLDCLETKHVVLAISYYIVTLLQLKTAGDDPGLREGDLNSTAKLYLPNLWDLRNDLVEAADEIDAKKLSSSTKGSDQPDSGAGNSPWKLPRGCFPPL